MEIRNHAATNDAETMTDHSVSSKTCPLIKSHRQIQIRPLLAPGGASASRPRCHGNGVGALHEDAWYRAESPCHPCRRRTLDRLHHQLRSLGLVRAWGRASPCY